MKMVVVYWRDTSTVGIKCLLSSSVGGEALVSSGIMESLLQVLDWKVSEPSNITVSAPYYYYPAV